MLIRMSAVRQQVEAGEAATFDISVTNEGDQPLYEVDVAANPSGGTFENLPEGVTSEGGTAKIAELPAGETLNLSYQAPAGASDSENTSIEGSVSATGRYGENMDKTVSATASASVGLQKPVITPTPAPTAAPIPSRLPVNVLIYGIAALALLLAIGLIWLARKRR
jgi:hypothetical protein